MLGAIAGDIIGSVYEHNPIKYKHFELFHPDCQFTDDTVLTVALADAILHRKNYVDKLKEYFQRYPDAGYGLAFFKWAVSDSRKPYRSYGNGAAMRISPVGFACQSLDSVLSAAEKYASVTHDHPEGIKGAQVTAAAIFLARQGESKNSIKEFVERKFGYNLSRALAEIRPSYCFDATCQGTVPQAIIAFLESENFEDAIRNAISLGGDSDTLACITGGIAQAFYGGVPEEITFKVFEILDAKLRTITLDFLKKYLPDQAIL
jgi:ADP-ribosylglycohydrolase